MKIGIDLIPLQTCNSARGIGIFLHDLIIKIIQYDQTNYYSLYNVPKNLFTHFTRDNVITFDRAALRTETDDLDLFIYSSLFELHDSIAPNPLEVKCKKAVIVYDLIPLIFWDHYISFFTDASASNYFRSLVNIQHFDIIFTLSNSTKNDLVSLLEVPKEKITVIYCGLHEAFLKEKSDHSTIQNLKSRYGIHREYLLCTPGFDYRKNIPGLFQAFSQLPVEIRERYDLVLVCKLTTRQKEILLNIWKELNLPPDHLVLTNYIPTEHLVILFDGAEIFIFPSLYEGFGIPVLESMSRGCPVVTSDISSLPEVCESAGLLVNPYNAKEISSAVEEILINNALRQKLITLGTLQFQKFTWKKVTERILIVFGEIAEKSPDVPCSKGTTRKRIAFFTPLNPIKSGISDYSEELLKFLKPEHEIDIFIDGNYTPNNPDIVNSFHIYPHTLFESKKTLYDLCIYQVGNSKYHSFMVEYLLKYPGIVVFHDVILPYLIESLCIDKEQNTFNIERYLDYVFNNHGYQKYCKSLIQYEQNIPIDHYDFSLHFLKCIVDRNYQILVHNEFSKQFIENAISFSNVHTITMGSPPAQELPIDREGLKITFNLKDHIIISAFGRITRTKRIDILLASVGKIIRQNSMRNVHLVLVGETDPSIEWEVKHIISREQLDDYITITGYVPIRDFSRYYEITDICVNLRFPTSGETSSTLITALMHGLPIVTSNVAQYKEYPDNCVWKVDIDQFEIDTLTDFLLELIRNKKLRDTMSMNSLRFAKEHHSMEKMVSDYCSVINHTINS